MTANERCVVVTGASTGIGEACVGALIRAGFFVFGSVRRDEDARRLAERHGAEFAPLLFDVTDAVAIDSARRTVEARLVGATLAGLVNNAGVALPGPLLHQPIEEFRRQLEVNLFGQLAVIQGFAPLLGAGAARRGAPGRIVNMSSVAGRMAMPFLGAYAASKHALEGFSDSLRRELMLFGVDVIVIEPGVVATPIWDKAERAGLERYEATPFATSAERLRTQALEQGRKGLAPERVAAAVVRALTERRPPTRIPVAPSPLLDWLLPRLLPDRLIDRLIAKRLGLTPQREP
ncbi:MAG TPA: SDR family oxidoreductase [Methylocystis sp.]|nr:SDR family oxidoreductase [Methylocystis sp.]